MHSVKHYFWMQHDIVGTAMQPANSDKLLFSQYRIQSFHFYFMQRLDQSRTGILRADRTVFSPKIRKKNTIAKSDKETPRLSFPHLFGGLGCLSHISFLLGTGLGLFGGGHGVPVVDHLSANDAVGERRGDVDEDEHDVARLLHRREDARHGAARLHEDGHGRQLAGASRLVIGRRLDHLVAPSANNKNAHTHSHCQTNSIDFISSISDLFAFLRNGKRGFQKVNGLGFSVTDGISSFFSTTTTR